MVGVPPVAPPPLDLVELAVVEPVGGEDGGDGAVRGPARGRLEHDQQAVAPLVDGEAELVGRPEPLLAGQRVAPRGPGPVALAGDHRRRLGQAEPLDRGLRARPGAEPGQVDGATGAARVAGQGEPQLVEEGEPSLLDVVVVEVPVDAAAGRRHPRHPHDGLGVVVVEGEEVTAEVQGAGLLPRVELLLEDASRSPRPAPRSPSRTTRGSPSGRGTPATPSRTAPAS